MYSLKCKNNESNTPTYEYVIVAIDVPWKDILPLTRDLVTIVTDYTKIDFKPEMLERQEMFQQEIYELLNNESNTPTYEYVIVAIDVPYGLSVKFITTLLTVKSWYQG